ncbi:MAG: hypothetical protein INF12_14785 [Methylobacterium sp.]|nr:hypothetical protein [Methylobacterium sp.]
MEKQSHTPGPWTLETVKTSCGICHRIGPFPWRDGRDNHACVYVDHASRDGSAPRDQELLANARLIAAAPELLAALRGLYETGAPEGLALTADEIQARFDAARAAIARAEGR